MLVKLLNLVGRLIKLAARLTGASLGALAVCTPFGNMLVCISIIFFGPAVVLGLLAQ